MKYVESLGPFRYTVAGKTVEAETAAVQDLENRIELLSRTYRGADFDLELSDARKAIEQKYGVEIGLDL